MGIRPEDLYDAAYVRPTSPVIDAKVEVTELMGNEVFLYLFTRGHSYVAASTRARKARVGHRRTHGGESGQRALLEKDTPENRAAIRAQERKRQKGKSGYRFDG